MRKRFAILIFHLICGSQVFTQDVYGFSHDYDTIRINKLKKILPSLKGYKKIDCLNELSEAHLPYQTGHAKVYANQALQEAEKTTYLRGKAEAYKNLGRIECSQINDLLLAEKYFSMSLALFIKIEDEEQIGWAWGCLGCSKWVLTKFPEAMYAFEKAEQIFKNLNDTSDLVYTYDMMTRTELESGHYEKAFRYTLKHQDLTGKEDYWVLSALYSAVGDKETSAEYTLKSLSGTTKAKEGWQYQYLTMAGTFSLNKQYDSALHYYQLFSNYAEKTGSNGPFIKLYTNLGELHFSLKQYDTAFVYLSKALRLSKKTNDRNQVMKVLLSLGSKNKELTNYNLAMQNAQELLQLAQETGARQYIRDAHFLLYQLFDFLKNRDSAYLHVKKYIAIKDSIELDLTAQKLDFFKTKAEREKTQSSINVLNEEKKMQQQQLKQAARQKNILIAGLAILLLAGITLFRNILLKRKNDKHFREIAESELRIQKLESQRQITEREMQLLRAQMNPHFVFNSLNSINRFIMENNKTQASEYLTKFSRLIRLILQNSSATLISLETELETLKLYLELESVRFDHQFEYIIRVDNDLDIAALKLPPLIIQPYAENAIWHGLMHAKRKGLLQIELYEEGYLLCCDITDDGIGRKYASELRSKSASAHKSMAMQITADRIAMLQQKGHAGTQIKITDLVLPDGSAGGTKVQLKIPVCYD